MGSVAVTVKEATAESADAIDQRRPRAMVAQEEVARALLELVFSGPIEPLRCISCGLLLLQHVTQVYEEEIHRFSWA